MFEELKKKIKGTFGQKESTASETSANDVIENVDLELTEVENVQEKKGDALKVKVNACCEVVANSKLVDAGEKIVDSVGEAINKAVEKSKVESMGEKIAQAVAVNKIVKTGEKLISSAEQSLEKAGSAIVSTGKNIVASESVRKIKKSFSDAEKKFNTFADQKIAIIKEKIVKPEKEEE